MINRRITNMTSGRALAIRQGYEADSLEVELFIYGSRGSLLGKIGLDQNDLRVLKEVIASLETQPDGCTCSSVRVRSHYPACALWSGKDGVV